MIWIALYGRRSFSVPLAQKAEKRVLDAVKDVYMRTHPHGPFVVGGSLPSKLWPPMRPPWTKAAAKEWAEESKRQIEDRYWSMNSDIIKSQRFVLDRLESEKGRSKVLGCFHIDFKLIANDVTMKSPGWDQPVLCFTFIEQMTTALWVFKDSVPVLHRPPIDDLFTSAGKPRPYSTPMAMRIESRGGGGKGLSSYDLCGVLAIMKALGNWHDHETDDARRQRFHRLCTSEKLAPYLESGAIQKTGRDWVGSSALIKELPLSRNVTKADQE